MKISVNKMIILIAIVLSLVAAQAVWARDCNVTVSGVITSIDDAGNAITVGDDTIIYGMALNYLANRLNIVLEVDDNIVIKAHQCPETGRLSACTISVNEGQEIYLPGGRSQ